MEHTPQLQNVTWLDVREQVKQVAPDIFEAIERMNPDKSYKLYKARYPFGAMIIGDNGVFNIPQGNQLLPISDPRVPKKLRDEFASRKFAIPMSLVLSGKIQVYTEEDSALTTEFFYGSGIVAALWGVLDPPLSYHTARFWRMTSGMRTFILC